MSGLFRGGKHERGDTIVEVMISLIVISSVIVGAFLVARVSSRNIRNSEEHSQALQMLQGQVEMLRAYAANDAAVQNDPLPASADFCMKSDGTIEHTINNCKNLNTFYNLTINQTAGPVNGLGATYTFKVDWPAQDGTTSQESIIYRVAQT
jgi:Tfp pilus assembly protein PilV